MEIFGVKFNNITYNELSDAICASIEGNSKILITYANAHTLNKSYANKTLINTVNSFDIVHPDGIGIYLASKILYKKNCLNKRFTGSDFYPIFAEEAIKNKWKVFFFGHDNETLNKIKLNYPDLIISGLKEGYQFNDNEVINSVNSSETDVLIIGFGFPKQEQWIYENKDRLKCKVILAVGEGIKVFAGTKIRGPGFIRALGLEWLVRFFANPIKFFSRYITGNPIFLCRIIILKMRNFGR
ncbi:MAG: WecB/TagA/CpsF family glycosyltransferase [Chlorobi bacterium]|nr:WecB/TagA/CpsF family glycosyltransferase [Chlorobiota bacterium]MCI0716896.1 WecB/TagA/CpsF family glycosyltransferase [Chlorobiota bacterium]